MPKTHRRNCDYCGNPYESPAKRFCSLKCRDEKRIGFRHSEETKNKIGLAHKGKFVSEESKKKLSKTLRRLYRKGEIKSWCKGLTSATDERVALRMFKSIQTKIKNGTHRGKNNPGWKGGISKSKYSWDWRRIRNAYRTLKNFICEICRRKAFGRKLDVHHKNFNKLNNDIKNLILVCRRCHRKIHPLRLSVCDTKIQSSMIKYKKHP